MIPQTLDFEIPAILQQKLFLSRELVISIINNDENKISLQQEFRSKTADLKNFNAAAIQAFIFNIEFVQALFRYRFKKITVLYDKVFQADDGLPVVQNADKAELREQIDAYLDNYRRYVGAGSGDYPETAIDLKRLSFVTGLKQYFEKVAKKEVVYDIAALKALVFESTKPSQVFENRKSFWLKNIFSLFPSDYVVHDIKKLESNLSKVWDLTYTIMDNKKRLAEAEKSSVATAWDYLKIRSLLGIASWGLSFFISERDFCNTEHFDCWSPIYILFASSIAFLASYYACDVNKKDLFVPELLFAGQFRKMIAQKGPNVEAYLTEAVSKLEKIVNSASSKANVVKQAVSVGGACSYSNLLGKVPGALWNLQSYAFERVAKIDLLSSLSDLRNKIPGAFSSLLSFVAKPASSTNVVSWASSFFGKVPGAVSSLVHGYQPTKIFGVPFIELSSGGISQVTTFAKNSSLVANALDVTTHEEVMQQHPNTTFYHQ